MCCDIQLIKEKLKSKNHNYILDISPNEQKCD